MSEAIGGAVGIGQGLAVVIDQEHGFHCGCPGFWFSGVVGHAGRSRHAALVRITRATWNG